MRVSVARRRTMDFQLAVSVVLVSALIASCAGRPGDLRALEATVTGLVGTGLVLEVNGATRVVVTGNGRVPLASLPAGTLYVVAVTTQPINPPQTCTVINPRGTAGTTDLTGPVVTCVLTYSVGGSVKGLLGTGLVLHSSLGDDLRQTNDGSFVFPGRFVSSAEYVVTVAAQPVSPAQTCTVENARGTVAGADVLNVIVVCSTEAFTVSGNVTGLTGAGLLLRNNGCDELHVTGGVFSFGQPVADGAQYAVSVSNQPINPSQTCSVERGTGTIGGAAVTTVHVVCSDNPYTVEVTVRGLTGTGLVLQNSGWDDLAVAGNGRAGFPNRLVDGAPYSVTVRTQPTDPAQSCSVANGVGTVGGADVTSVIVSCRGWGAAQLMEIDDAGSATDPQVAMNEGGTGTAVWTQTFNGRFMDVVASRFEPETGWGTPYVIDTENYGGGSYPQVAMNGAGNAFAVWHQSDGMRNHVWASRCELGTAWSSAQRIETDELYNAHSPQVAADPSGNAIAVWAQSDGTRDNIWANRYALGTRWGTAELIEGDDAGFARAPTVAMDAGGNAVAVWSQSDGTRDNIWANRYAAKSGWGLAGKIESGDAGNAGSPHVAVDRLGNAIAVWQLYDGVRNRILAARYALEREWEAEQVIDIGAAGNASSPKVEMDAGGNAIVVWSQSNSDRTRVWANRYVPGTGWGTARAIDNDDSSGSGTPGVAMDGAGNALVVWTQLSNASSRRLWANRYLIGTGWGTAQPSGSHDMSTGSSPRMASDGAGNAIVVWGETGDSYWNIWTSNFR